MADSREEIAKALLLSTWERYDRAIGRIGIGIVLLLLIHLQVAQYLDLDLRIASARNDEKRIAGELAAVNDIGTALHKLSEHLEGAIESVLDQFVPSLRAEFVTLDSQYRHHLSPALQKDLPPEPPRPLHAQTAGPGGLNVQQFDVPNMNMPIHVQGGLPPTDLSDQAKAELAAARTMDQLIDVLHGIAEREIVRPTFLRLNQEWVEFHQDAAVKEIDAVVEKVKSAKAEAAPWSVVQGALESARRTIESFRFEQPAVPRWWATVQGKAETGIRLSDDARGRMVDQLPLRAVNQIEQALQAAVEKQNALAAALTEELETIQDQFSQLQQRAGSLGKPFEFVSLELKTTAEHFPLLVGVVCGAGLAWLGYWRGRLFRAASWMRMADMDAQTLSAMPLWEDTTRARFLGELFGCLIAVGWIALAAWQLARNRGPLPPQAIGEAAIAVLAVVLALIYRSRSAAGARNNAIIGKVESHQSPT